MKVNQDAGYALTPMREVDHGYYCMACLKALFLSFIVVKQHLITDFVASLIICLNVAWISSYSIFNYKPNPINCFFNSLIFLMQHNLIGFLRNYVHGSYFICKYKYSTFMVCLYIKMFTAKGYSMFLH